MLDYNSISNIILLLFPSDTHSPCPALKKPEAAGKGQEEGHFNAWKGAIVTEIVLITENYRKAKASFQNSIAAGEGDLTEYVWRHWLAKSKPFSFKCYQFQIIPLKKWSMHTYVHILYGLLFSFNTIMNISHGINILLHPFSGFIIFIL